ncbi:hypothetical protein KOEU_37340 [Komagataeibacter europaeus]|uniref:HNH nuclease domain-containing protein n=2 Tax=Komagataeibacter europaeus TaxID=33995 RepID=A0A0M0EBY2_KOMEU|nr:hypothetical protein KOEU_37340 [Komagataeibacter europaeus]
MAENAQVKPTALARFNKHVNFNGPMHPTQPELGCCHVWTGWRLKHRPYGKFSCDGKTHRVHRWRYEHENGPIPDGLHLDHTCDNTFCVNPSHLEPVTAQENMRRRGIRKPTRASRPPMDEQSCLMRAAIIHNALSADATVAQASAEVGGCLSTVEKWSARLQAERGAAPQDERLILNCPDDRSGPCRTRSGSATAGTADCAAMADSERRNRSIEQ